MMSNMPAALAETDGSRLPSTRGGSTESGKNANKNEFAAVLADSDAKARSAEKPDRAAPPRDKDGAGKDTASEKTSASEKQPDSARTTEEGAGKEAETSTHQKADNAPGDDRASEEARPGTADGDGSGASQDATGLLEGTAEAATGDAESGNVLPLTGEMLPPAVTTLPPGFAVRAPGTGPMPGVLDPSAAAALLDGELPAGGLAAGGLAAGGLAAGADGPDSLTRMLEMLRTLNGMPGHFREQLQGAMLRKSAAGLELGDAPRSSGPLVGNSALQGGVGASPLANLAAQAGTPPSTPPSLPINIAPGRPDWGEAVGQRVLWMVSNKAQEAELRLNPSELGRVDVKVRVDEDGLRLTFAAGNTAVREALEAAAPRLREMFQAEGLQLEHMDISQQQAGADKRGDGTGDPVAEHGTGDRDEDALSTASSAPRSGLGLVDLFV